MQTRRDFLRNTGIAAAVMANADLVRAEPLSRPVGLQLYTVGEQLGADFQGTLKKIADIGYKEVELADAYKKSAAEIRTAFSDVGLTCRSAHMFDMSKTPAQFMDFVQELGAKYVITSFNPPESAMASFKTGKPDMGAFLKALEDMSLDDYKRSADTCNKLGEEAKKHGLQYAYHNHNLEFKKLGGSTAYDLLLSSTDKDLVKFELDCGWMAAAGYDPVAYLKKYPKRYRLLHIKAFKKAGPSLSLGGAERPTPTELGRGGIDYKPVFAAAKKTEVEQYYVEQEPPFTEMPALEAIKVDYDFLHNLKA
ncbi:MAG TPA: sugar phosphate isomerase/epimerase [Terriglobales bacterium]|jgi:sugar phosphate isomerase/epimerase|nr:sugar phosphate isomerase/epimerase [Terriglobales bacterium]